MTLVVDEALDLDPAQEAGSVVSRVCGGCDGEFPLENEFFRWRPPQKGRSRGLFVRLCRVCECADRNRRRKNWAVNIKLAEPEVGDLLQLPPVTDAEVAWKQRARCRGLDWFSYTTTQQKEICGTCMVVQECRGLADMVETSPGFKNRNSQIGVWGRLGPTERRKRREFIAKRGA